MGGTVEEFLPERGCFYINFLGKRIMIERKISIARESFISGRMTRCKDLTYKILREYDLPTPDTKCFYKKTYNRDNAINALSQLKYPVILKDAQGSNSKGIFPFIYDAGEALEVLEEQMPKYRSMIAQTMVFGKEFRLLVLHDRIIGALEMIPPYIMGNGSSTIEQLIKEKQCTTEKRTKIDDKLKQLLIDQNVSLETVLPKGKGVYIKKSSSLAEGGEMRDVTDLVHKDIEKICVQASEVIGKNLAGIDVMCEDISKALEEQSFNIIEINGKPDLYIHYNPKHGETRNVIEEIVRFMVKIAK